MESAIQTYIEQTNLKPEATADEIKSLVEEAHKYEFRGVCVHPKWLPELQKWDPHHRFLHVTVVAFPLGVAPEEALISETRWCVLRGADEIDMVIDRGLLLEGDLAGVQRRIQLVKEAAVDRPVKVILESGALTRQQLQTAIDCAVAGGADFVKTSTGFMGSGATVEAVRRMKRGIPESMAVKASGGIRSYGDAVAMIQAGASRIGTSSGVAIVEGAEAAGKKG